jgi:hypothetical protein
VDLNATDQLPGVTSDPFLVLCSQMCVESVLGGVYFTSAVFNPVICSSSDSSTHVYTTNTGILFYSLYFLFREHISPDIVHTKVVVCPVCLFRSVFVCICEVIICNLSGNPCFSACVNMHLPTDKVVEMRLES